MAVTIDDVRHIASLARLGLTDTRATAIVNELNTILPHKDELAKVTLARKIAAVVLRLWKKGELWDPKKLTIQAT